MNKTVKGSLAGAAGIALLMGGFGSYALWTDSENLAATGVDSGQLNIDTTAGVWDDTSHSGTGDWTPGTDKMVPGDVVTYTQTFTVKGDGKNLKGTLALADPGAIQQFSTLTRTIHITSSNSTVSPDSGSFPNTAFHFNAPFGTSTMTAVVTYTLPSTTTNLVDQNKSTTTPATAFTITQTAN